MSFGSVVLPVPWSKKVKTQDFLDKFEAGLRTHKVRVAICCLRFEIAATCDFSTRHRKNGHCEANPPENASKWPFTLCRVANLDRMSQGIEHRGSLISVALCLWPSDNKIVFCPSTAPGGSEHSEGGCPSLVLLLTLIFFLAFWDFLAFLPFKEFLAFLSVFFPSFPGS